MSRVNEAMRRAGQNDDVNAATAAAADPEFISGEDSVEDPQPEPEAPISSGRLVPRPRSLPIDVVPQESRDEVDILDVVRLLFRRWRLIALVIAAAVGLAVIYNARATPVYQARARLLIEPDPPRVVPFQPLTEDTGRFDYFTTQLEVLRSRDLALKTMQRLQLDRLPGGLSVTAVRSDLGPSRVVNLAFVGTNPELATRVLNTLAQTYVDENLELRRRGSREAAKWLNERLTELRQQVNASQSALQRYREEKDSVSLGNQQNIVVQKLDQLNSSLTTARTERLAKEALYEQLTTIEKSGAPLDTFPAILSNTFIQGLKAELAGLQRERVQLAERLGDLHPDMIRVDTAIVTAESRLKAETDKLVAGIRNDYTAAQLRERGLAGALEAQKREVLDLNQQGIGYGALQRDATSNQQIFESVLQRLKEAELSGELQSNNVRILDAAEVPRLPIWPRTWLNLMMALLGGTFVAVVLVIGLEFLNPRITKPSDISGALGLALLGVTPRVDALKKGRAPLGSLPVAFQEALRGIRTRILLSPTAPNARTLAVTSTGAGEGKTIVASSLAVSMAMAGRRVLLVDADMRRPQLHRLFDVSPSPGLANIMAGEAKPSEALLKSTVTGLFILPAGADVASPSDLLDSERLSGLIEGFSQVFDVVVLDCPPVLALADASIMANAASAVVFVVGAGTTTREGAQAAIDRLTSVQARVIGVVLNNVKSDHQSGYYYPYYQSEETA